MLDLAALASRAARTAIRAPGVELGYADLAALARSARAHLEEQGVRPGERVMLGCAPSIATIAGALALLDLGCVVLPFAADASTARSRDAFAPAWVVREVSVARCAAGPGAAPGIEAGGDRPLQALSSSGSSGRPKIVLRSAAQVEAGVRIFATAMRLDAEDRVLALVPFEHSFGFNSVMLGALSVGAAIVLPGSRHPRGVVRDVEESGATLFPAPPIFFDWMRRFAEERCGSLGRVRACVSVGDVLARATHAAFVETFGVALWQSYGASEAGPALLNQSGACAGDTLSLGLPYPEVAVDLCDAGGEPVRDGETGEIVVRSPAVGIGYLGEHDGASRIVSRSFFSGDLGVRGADGFHFAGRRKVFIARAGRKIDPAEIENVLRAHPDVLDAAVRGAGAGGEEILQALVVTRCQVAAADLIALCARSLEPHKVPRLVEFRSALPRDAAGKLQRARLSTW